LITTVPLDAQVDTQPLVVRGQRVAGHDPATVVYVATEGNTVYAIDGGGSGGFLTTPRNLGTPVPQPANCTDNKWPPTGINGTPAIDVGSQTLYVIAYVRTQDPDHPQYMLHALDLGTLADKMGSPVPVVVPTHVLSDNKTSFNFVARAQRQRTALLLSGGNVYAGFGSFCDEPTSRGWVLGWDAKTLQPLNANALLDTSLPQPASGYAKSFASVWMSGYGLAADSEGSIYFSTGNGDPTVQPGSSSLKESVVKMSADLQLQDWFAPWNWNELDTYDREIGKGGVLLLPDQPGGVIPPHLAVVAGWDKRMYVLNRDKMGTLQTLPDQTQNVDIGRCWCGQSYFQGADGIGRVVSSGGNQVKVWKVNGSSPALPLSGSFEASAALETTPQDGGFFTTVSSGPTGRDAIIWAVGRPSYPSYTATMYAFDATGPGPMLPPLWSDYAGSWPYAGYSPSPTAEYVDNSNANIVPTVAAGRVFVASYKQLRIFGLRRGQPSGSP
jgi:hypothetical protein